MPPQCMDLSDRSGEITLEQMQKIVMKLYARALAGRCGREFADAIETALNVVDGAAGVVLNEVQRLSLMKLQELVASASTDGETVTWLLKEVAARDMNTYAEPG